MIKPSSFKKKKVLVATIAILLVAVAVFLLYEFFLKKPSDPVAEIIRKSANPVIRELNNNREFMEGLKPETLPEYFRTRLLFYENTDKDPYPALETEIGEKFPGEQGRVTVEILSSWKHYTEGLKELGKKQGYRYDFLIDRNRLRQGIFGPELSQRMFPPLLLDKTELFYTWALKFLDLNPLLTIPEKTRQIEKKRVEIYGMDYDFLVSRQPFAREYELQTEIRKRELAVMNPLEKRKILDEIREEISR